MKKGIKILFLAIFINSGIVYSQNTGSNGNTWYKINSKGKFVTKIKGSGPYAEHEVIVHIINQHWSTAEINYLSEFNYKHKRVKLEWGYTGDGSSRFLTVRLIPVSASHANSFTFQDVSDPSFDYVLTPIDASLVTTIEPNNRFFINEWDGNVGIGTTSPSEKFEVFDGNITISNTSYSNKGFLLDRQNYGFKHKIWAESIGVYFDFSTDNFATHTRALFLKKDGNIGIGTTKPDSKLTVAGNVHAQEVKVTINAGADFVFDDSYQLPNLKELEAFIKTNKHLPEIASAKEMETNGLDLGKMNLMLLQKIEELTLYTIEQEKKIEVLEKENQGYKGLEKRLLKIETLLN